MEEQHPIPQQISAYQFRLVGDMTLKQFFQVAGGALIALLIYASPLHTAIKWPAILISFLFGVALAFFPIEDRPLEKWIFSFFKSIYSPTIFVWKKTKEKPIFFKEEKAAPAVQVSAPKPTEEAVPASEPTVQVHPSASGLEQTEQEFLSKVAQRFGEPAVTVAPTPTPSASELTPPRPAAFKPTIDVPVPEPGKAAGKMVFVPKEAPTYVEKKERPEEAVERPGAPGTVYVTPTPFVGQKAPGAVAAKFSMEAAPPSLPTKANVVVGQVMDAAGKIVDGAILEIKDEEGRAVRALKTNKLGHFMIVTPLVNGRHEIITEKEGLQFTPVAFEAGGAIIPPIAIWAKGAAKNGEPGK